MLAYAVMASVRYQANSLKPKKTQLRTRQSLSAGPFRRSGASS
ncbi:transposase (plasmid) [Acetobacter pasteurianus IFO 3283-22]|nr:transposase [Acetobacter pasteurianus IFO 3283-01]BAI02993.1 transposase [Acetobacter pasteurianus IFO 3283-03]BAI06038.1 transposase [Acetobacter pasteurianus IFO 3283-07]BAI09088.1 transposase [Acetobacter pasteurianus IFO 3283-22]BAI12136.1 transposase [Acetobacter pasteurianus IFO 3283-26]BAI15181.1 transposase [Acetobacter pasteurianus IFO 3283-32]BAI18161.1 transposase [Acetobacter pasteurianus IFO 3283-01-42C]BAI21211.1 transposase [Acetobacter pasteurianus IFO 3283-12]